VFVTAQGPILSSLVPAHTALTWPNITCQCIIHQ